MTCAAALALRTKGRKPALARSSNIDAQKCSALRQGCCTKASFGFPEDQL
jgi:hypothetical protein